MARKINHWYIDEPEVLHIIVEEGYHYLPTEHPRWYDSDYPIDFNEKKGLLRSRGTRLTCLTDAEIQANEVADFDRRLGLGV